MDEQQTTISGSIIRILKLILEKFKPRSEERTTAYIVAAATIIAAIIAAIMGGIFLYLNTRPTPTPSATQQAQALILQYYADINKGDYQSAYSLWSTHHQTYDQFVSGYAKTRHDDIIFGDITPLSDGTVSVAITIKATEDVSGGKRVSSYQGTYIVGIQNGTWMILNANFPNLPG